MSVRTVISVAGLVVEVRAHDAPVELASALFGPAATCETAVPTPVATVEFVVGAPEWPARAPDAEYPPLQRWDDPVLSCIATADVSAIVRGTAARIVGPAEQLEGALPLLRHHVLARLFAPKQVWTVHAATLSNGPTTALGLGQSGVGKSTLALAGLEAGWSVHGDDIALLRSGHDDVAEVATLGFELRVPTNLGSSRASAAPRLRGDRRERSVLTAEQLAWRRVTDLVVLSHGDTPVTAIRDENAPRTLHALLESFAAHPAQMSRSAFMAFAARASRLPAWNIALGSDAGRRIATTATALASLTRAG